MNLFNQKSKNVKTKQTKNIDNIKEHAKLINTKCRGTLDVIEHWCCPICLNNLNEVTDFAYPFDCKHLTCYKCFCDQVKYYINNNIDPFSLKCSLCSNDVKENWKKTSILKGEYFIINGYNVRIYSPKILS
tara:strand:+ start:459 stop:851 length:393 start_codon:yes stop_codon:yes gene_type:complete